jgi:hypothetical protein
VKYGGWRLKRLWMAPFMGTRLGENLYEWLTARVLGTERGMSRKWCCWFREHLVLSRRFGRAAIPGCKLWLLSPGWSLAPVIMGRMVTGKGPSVTEERPRLARRYLASAVDEVAKVAESVSRAAGLSTPDLTLLDALRSAPSPRAAIEACGADYLVGRMGRIEGPPAGSASLCMSMGRLEHFTESELADLFGLMRRALQPGGVGSHIVDHRDHYWHFDKSIHCFHHLTFSDKDWSQIAHGEKAYRNRLLESDYVRLFEAAGFRVRACIHETHRHDADGVDPATLWGRYRDLTRADLEAAVTHFIVRRK